jgi:hypothetical protein
MRFKITTEEAKTILEMHSKMKNNHSIIIEQDLPKTEESDESKLKRAVAAGCVSGGTLYKSASTGKVYYRKPSVKQPNKTVDFFADLTYEFTDKSIKGTWKCDEIKGTFKPELSTQPKLTPQQQRSVDDKINFYKGLYQKEQPTADQITKKEWEKVNLKNEPGFEGIIDFDYFIWKKTGKRQTKSPQQEAAIKTYTDNGWSDIGGTINPTDVAKYDTVDLKDVYGTEYFPESYKLVKPIDSVDTNQVIEELNNLVKTKNFGDKKTCRNIISKYNVAKKKNAPINDAILRNWKIAVNACKTKIDNFNDIGVTNGILKTLTVQTIDKDGKPITPAVPQTENEKRWDINLTPTPRGATPTP